MPVVARAGASLYYEVHGEGRPLVFAHGAGGNAASWWQQVPFFVGRGYRVVCFDHRGFGRSGCAPEHFLPEHFPADLCAVLDAEGLASAALVCQSMGGWTGLPTALAHPDRVEALVLGGTPAGVWTDAVAAAFAGVAERIAQQGGLVGPGGAALGASFRAAHPDRAHLYEQIAAFNPPLDPSGVAKIAAIRLGPDDLARYRTPTLLISGDEDVLFPREALASVAGTIPGARLEPFDGVGHSAYFEVPQRFNEVVAAFLESARTA